MELWVWFIAAVGLVGCFPLAANGERNAAGTCLPVTVSFCEDVGYSTTPHPTGLPGVSLSTVRSIVQSGCSPQASAFWCRVVAPECDVPRRGVPTRPCRALCEKVKSDCSSRSWPQSTRCDDFPEQNCFDVEDARAGSCQPISVPMCRDLVYNETVMPNLAGHRTQDEAGHAVNSFYPLVIAGCSPQLRDFLCSVFTPRCVSGRALRPCKTLCEQAHSGCEVLMSRFGFDWPNIMQCDAFTTESCDAEDGSPERMSAVDVLRKLEESGSSVRDQSLSLQTAHVLLTFKDADKSGTLDVQEFLQLQHHVDSTRRQYMQSNEWKNTGHNTEEQLRNALGVPVDEQTIKSLWNRFSSQSGINYDQFMTVVTKVEILKERFQANQMSLPCDCKVASFSFDQFIQAAIM